MQDIFAIAIALCAVAYLGWLGWQRFSRGQGKCGSCPSCPTDSAIKSRSLVNITLDAPRK